MKEKLKELWNKFKTILIIIFGGIATVLSVLFLNSYNGKKEDKLVIDTKVKIKESENNDEKREDVKTEIKNAQKENDEIIKKNQELLAKVKERMEGKKE